MTRPESNRAKNILKAVREVTQTTDQKLGLHEPFFGGKEEEWVSDCIRTGWVSYAGAYVNRFECDLSSWVGGRRVSAVSNGTVALQLALKAVGVEAGDEVLVPALTFVATANAVAHAGATPHFVDSEKETLGVCPERLREYLREIGQSKSGVLFNRKTSKPIRALVIVHILGHPCSVFRLHQVAEEFGLVVVEDSAEALGSEISGKRCGQFGKVSTLSFNGNKVVTTGGGGAIVSEDPAITEWIRHVSTTAKAKHPWEFVHDEVGYNFRLPNLNAALGCAQLLQLPDFLRRKRALAKKYKNFFDQIDGVEFLDEPAGTLSNFWLNSILLNGPIDLSVRDEILGVLHQNGVLARPLWRLMHRLPMYEKNPRMELPTAEDLEKRVIVYRVG